MVDTDNADEEQQVALAEQTDSSDSQQEQTDPQQQEESTAAGGAPQPPKEVIATKVSGTVKWYNVKRGFGYIHCNETDEEVFVHLTAITKFTRKKRIRSIGDGEAVEFDIVVGEKGKEAANVTGPGGVAVKGSRYAPDRLRIARSRGKKRRRQSNAGTGHVGNGNVQPIDDDNEPDIIPKVEQDSDMDSDMGDLDEGLGQSFNEPVNFNGSGSAGDRPRKFRGTRRRNFRPYNRRNRRGGNAPTNNKAMVNQVAEAYSKFVNLFNNMVGNQI